MNTEPTCCISAGFAARVKHCDSGVPCTVTVSGALARAFETSPPRHATGTRCSSLPPPASSTARTSAPLQMPQLYAWAADQRGGRFTDESTCSHGCEPAAHRSFLHALRHALERE